MRGWGAWIVYGIVAALSLAGCIAIPPLGTAGWVLLIFLYFMAHRTEQLEARVSELEDERDEDD